MANGVTPIQETCHVIQEERISIDRGPRKGGIIHQDSPLFLNTCIDTLTNIVDYQTSHLKLPSPQIWTSLLVRDAASYSRRRKVPLVFLGPEHPSGNGIATALSSRGQTIYLGLGARVNLDLEYGLDHEWGHLRDNALIATESPGIKEMVKRGAESRDDLAALAEALFGLMRQRLSPTEQSRLDTLRPKILNDVFDITAMDRIVSILAELLRHGEEIHDTRFEDNLFSPYFVHLKKGGPAPTFYEKHGVRKEGQFIDLLRLTMVAIIQEAGLWDKFRAQPNYDPSSVDTLDPEQIEFFRLCIRGASKYFVPGAK